MLAVAVFHQLGRALSFAGGMTWEILWALVLGFLISALVQALVSKQEMRLLPDDSPRTLAVATGLGAASSSCSYAAVALARSLFVKGADFTAAMAFEVASTNLVVELGVVMALILGWQFTLAEFVGAPIMIVLLALLFRVFLTRRLVEEARAEAEKGRRGSMEGHAAMDMSISARGSILQRLATPEGFTATANVFVSEWGGDPARPRRRPADRRRARGLGTQQVVAGSLLPRASDLRQVLGDP
ncbi:MAG TPA: permease [Solirubrobacteraceae bacterium]|nr:permease [Solirubrobacteraceae bacterium]